MIQKLAKLGRILPDEMVDIDPLNLATGDSIPEHIVFICFESRGLSWQFKQVEMEEFALNKQNNYLLIRAKGNGRSEFPTIEVFNNSEIYKDGTVDFESSKKGAKLLSILKKHYKELSGIVEQLISNQEIGVALTQKTELLSQFVLSIKLNSEMVGTAAEFRSKIAEVRERAINRDYKVFPAQNKICSISGEVGEVFGNSTFYSFYATKTNISAVAGGFDKKQSWKNFPTSEAGILNVERGKWFIERHLSFRFCGVDYFLIPEVLLTGSNTHSILHGLKRLDDFRLKNRNSKFVELNLVKMLASQNNSATFTMFFFERNKSQFKILLSIDDISPTYAVRLHNTIEQTEELAIFKNFTGKDGKPYSVTFDSFGALRTFFPNAKIEGNHTARFLEVVRAVLMQRTVTHSVLLRYIMMKIRRIFVEGNNLRFSVLRAWLILLVFDQMKIVKVPHDQTEAAPMNMKLGTMGEIVREFFSTHPEFHKRQAACRGAFLLGVLAKKVLDIQYGERQSEPFRARLNGMHISQKTVKRLMAEIPVKLEEYNKNYQSYKDLNKLAASELAHLDDNLSDDDRSFYFALGMALEEHFRVSNKD